MPDFSKRSYQKELLDGTDIPFSDIRRNMQELNRINTLLGGHTITVAGFKAMMAKNNQTSNLSICEVGCGGGDNLKTIEVYCQQHRLNVHLTGIDLNPSCIAFAQEQYPAMAATWIANDYAATDLSENKADIIFSSLLTHHFSNEDLVTLLRWKMNNSRLGFFINDLQRSPVAYYAIKLITRLFSKSYLVKNDAPLSVARSFKRNDWVQLLQAAGITNYVIHWKWAFRYLIVCKHKSNPDV